ncbi:unnamed protein product [Mytilus coruscus]|uniref:Uncharacterized protein n=1 Tax=Mytilus coruscus TaxID=42192 RepID=A0A6J8DV24_MYTCO|nr:unnamed protein product [Mytilus coruscus]
MVHWNAEQKLKFSCNIDTTYFPFDSQSLTFRVRPSGLANFETEVTSSDSVFTNDYCSNSEWELVSSSITVDNTDGSQMDVTLKYKRRPLFLLVNLALPIMLLAVLNIFVFILPAESEDRIGFSITILLAVVVFMTIAQGLLPATALPRLAALCTMLMVDMLMSGMILISVIIGSWFYHRPQDKQVPKWFQKIITLKKSTSRVDSCNIDDENEIRSDKENNYKEKVT